MSKHVRWLLGELELWEGRGLISREQAGQIRNLYPELPAALPWGTIIFSGIGAVIAGLGVILLLAYNWQVITKGIKLGIIFGALGGVYAVGLWLVLRQDWRRQVGEAMCLLGAMLFGAGIWLIAQIYHIDEHFPNGFLMWGLGVLALAWVMPSLAQALLATVLLSIWGCTEAWGYRAAMQGAPLLILLALGGLAWRLRSAFLLYFVLPAFFLTLLANVSVVHEALLLRVALNFSVLFVAWGLLAQRHGWFPASARAWNFYGWLGALFCLFLLTFPEAIRHLLERPDELISHPHSWVPVAYDWIPLALAILAWSLVAWPWRPGAPPEKRPTDCTFEFSLLPLTAITAQVVAATGLVDEKWTVAAMFNLVFLALAATWMSRGCRTGVLRPTVLGSLLLAALVFARYGDLFESLLTRGLIFLAGGGLFIAEGIFFRRARKLAQRKEVAS